MKQLAEISVAIAAATLGVGAFAQGAPATSAGVSIKDETQRLACYDATHRRDAAIPMPTEPPPALAAPPAALATPAADVGLSPGGGAGPWLSKLWDLRPEDKLGTLQLRPHRANYQRRTLARWPESAV